MAFVKLDSQILESSIWLDKPARDVFITALLMAVPRAFEDDEPAIDVMSLEPSGFVVPRGEYGFVAASGAGIVQRALVGRKEGMDALVRLCSPESDSRSREFDGRRMARVNHGYVILNFRRFRDMDHTAAARQARYRLKKAAETSPATSRNVTSRRNVTQGRGQRAEGREEKKKTGASGGANGQTAVAVFCDAFKKTYGASPSTTVLKRAAKEMKALIAEHGEAVYGAAVAAYFASKDRYVLKHAHDPKHFVGHFDEFSLIA